MKRPTAYLVIDELAKRISGGSAEEKKKKYVALSPERLADALEDRAMVLKRALPELLSFTGDRPTDRMCRYLRAGRHAQCLSGDYA